MSINIDHLSADELVALNHHIIERLKMLKMLESLEAHKSMMQFHSGARVSFDSPNNGRLSGTIMKFNRKSVTVVTDNGQRWNISPGVRIVVASPVFPEKAYRGRKETGRAVLFT